MSGGGSCPSLFWLVHCAKNKRTSSESLRAEVSTWEAETLVQCFDPEMIRDGPGKTNAVITPVSERRGNSPTGGVTREGEGSVLPGFSVDLSF